ncbi:Hsp20 family protein [Sinorhizobium meliloti]|uniref:Hsp20/alpha crystallin family protein n=1 Tax=Rhizobium meliloti TaxID=382 RepID=UPI000FD4EE52|nr:Hsp20/alpha crystallin family protein [Sinorhizobium meliloti]MDW9531678.1 Hsp20 family protein [Sinorhizobium meliloti]MDW9900724.1 Hsp20 family protein [Sinorhizobium meliloti]MQV37282.1 Hsp20 family protein [Sinorhizobium meliloti]RVO94273.1 Hsp20/alpha crystallin family protein [Sinorhizobium meliloti]RVP76964.1 Hsp20/alpha crystallin family protein [Sinorhizobium meliloti]
MNVRDLIPWGRAQGQVPASYRDNDRNPFLALHREMNRLFDDAFAGGWPSVEVSDRDKEIKVTAELPGLDEKDVELSLSDGVLSLRGEKRAETEDQENQFSERYYGRFERRIALGYEVDESKVNATFRNGVLTVTLPKTEQAQSKAKRIAINGR